MLENTQAKKKIMKENISEKKKNDQLKTLTKLKKMPAKTRIQKYKEENISLHSINHQPIIHILQILEKKKDTLLYQK